MLASSRWQVAAVIGRLLLLGAVAIGWGGFVVPQLVSLAFPGLLPPDALPRNLDFGIEGSVANAVSSTAFFIVAALALANSLVGRRRREPWFLVAGWAVLGVFVAYLAWDELMTDLHREARVFLRQTLFADSGDAWNWAVHLSLLPMALGLALCPLIVPNLRSRAVALPLGLGFSAWVLAIVVDISQQTLFAGRADALEVVFDETLELSGSLLIALGAGVALRWGTTSQRRVDPFLPQRLRRTAIGSVALVAALGALAVGFLFRAPLVDAQSDFHFDVFPVILGDQEAAVQELHMPAGPVGSVNLRVASQDPAGRAGTVGVRLTRRGTVEPILAEGSATAPSRSTPDWVNITLYPKLLEPQGQPLALAVVADLNQDARLLVSATKRNRHAVGDLWINGQTTWPDQSLEFVAYGTSELTRGKLAGLLTLLTSSSRWPLLLADIVIALTYLTFIPALLVSIALPRPSVPPPAPRLEHPPS